MGMVAIDYEQLSASDSQVIWRYMALERFEDLLDSRLYFAAAHQFEDAFEGAASASELARRRADAERVLPKDLGAQDDLLALESRAFEDLRRMTKVNCWHAAEHENVAMWDRYLRGKAGVAVVSTVRRLKDCMHPFRLEPHYGEEPIVVGRVEYLDFDTEEMRDRSMLGTFLHKRREYRDEREVRALLSLRMASEFGVQIPADGVVVRVDPRTLADRVVAWPEATDDEMADLAQIAATAGLESPIVPSTLSAPPTY